jgi:TPR repeat protein
MLGSAYDTGTGVPRDATEAEHWYKAAADQGYAEAENSLGSALQAEGKYAEARAWYQKAADQGHALATNNLAYLYDLGLGIPQDRQRAFQLYSQAADLGWAEAMWNLANMYGAGQLGKPADLKAACIWTLRAEHYGASEPQLMQMIARIKPYLEKHLASDEMASCRGAALGWQPTRTAEAAKASASAASR